MGQFHLNDEDTAARFTAIEIPNHEGEYFVFMTPSDR